MLPSQARGYAKTRRDARTVLQRDNRVHDVVPSQRRDPQPRVPVEASLVDQSRNPYSAYSQSTHNHTGPPPSYRSNPSVTTFTTPRHKSRTSYPTPPDSPADTNHLDVDGDGNECADSRAFDGVDSRPHRRMGSTHSVQTASTIRLEDLAILQPPASPNSPNRRTLVYDEAAYTSPTSSPGSPSRIPGAELARTLAAESVTTLPSYASMVLPESDLAAHEYSDGDVSADLDSVRDTLPDLWKRTIICLKCHGTAVCGNSTLKFSIRDIDLKATDTSPCPSLDTVLIRYCRKCGTYCCGCYRQPQCLSPKNCKRHRSVASYEIIASLEDEIIHSGGVSKFLTNIRTWETLNKAFKALTFYFKCDSQDNSQWNCDDLLRLSLLPRVIQSVLEYRQLSNWLGSQHKPGLYTAVFDFLEVLLLRPEDRGLFTERWICIKDNSGGLRNWMEYGGSIEIERGKDGKAIRIPSFQELLRQLRDGPWWRELTNYTKTGSERVGASYARDWLMKVEGMLK
ncbi:hypothetical protein IW261DRAFT_1592232 [Armillaria novae-zelandiae]|uniref:Uncharacterized protein n=1 Tax=Armillaria novae-zelandiae TaxID=153914 RepID=A0AA39PF59_9AGAR|nr:hypothetical protein IW261DRAFT_1592232 [Armillaria novae-zelandiae]